MDMRRIRIALASPRDAARLNEEYQRDDTELANARRRHDEGVRRVRIARSTTRQRWATPPDGD